MLYDFRMELQTQREAVSKDVDEFRIENQKYMKQMNKKVAEGKSMHEALTREVGSHTMNSKLFNCLHILC
jgi:hypothetical protein